MSLDPQIKIHTANYPIFMPVTVKPVILSQTGAKTDNKSLLFRLANISFIFFLVVLKVTQTD